MKAQTAPARGQVHLRINSEGINHLSSLNQFHGIPDESLIRLAERRTRLKVPDRWVAIALILGNRIPIPVPAQHQNKTAVTRTSAPPKLTVIHGGRFGR